MNRTGADIGKVMRLASALGLDPLELTEKAGYGLAETLPPLKPYLRSRYPDLPAGAHRAIAEVISKYGIDPERSGPLPGEDET